mmetsp:Transcript_24241/g.33623  ORF Transcript_24241/g.33623 Transcript_24241/m.33623 type:complete len:1051 (-) Transcript_24241:220-3372(-)
MKRCRRLFKGLSHRVGKSENVRHHCFRTFSTRTEQFLSQIPATEIASSVDDTVVKKGKNGNKVGRMVRLNVKIDNSSQRNEIEAKLEEFQAFVKKAACGGLKGESSSEGGISSSQNQQPLLVQAAQIRELLLLLNQREMGIERLKNGHSMGVAQSRHNKIWNCYLSACAHQGDPVAAVAGFERMLMSTTAMTASTETNDIDPRNHHDHHHKGLINPASSEAYIHVMEAFASVGDKQGAEDWFRKRLSANYRASDPRACNAILHAYLRSKDIEKTHRWMRRMEQMRVSPDLTSYNLLLYRCSITGAVDHAERLLAKAKQEGLQPEYETYRNLVGAFIKAGGEANVGKAERMLEEMAQTGFSDAIDEDIVIRRKIIEAYAHCKRLDDAEKALQTLLERGDKPTRKLYSAIVFQAAKSRDVDRVKRLLTHPSCSLGVGPDHLVTEHVYCVVMAMYAQMGAFDDAEEVLQSMDEIGVTTEKGLKAIVEVCAICERWKEATAYMEEMKARDKVYPCSNTYRHVLLACAKRGAYEAAEQIFHDMKESGIPYEKIHFSLVRQACLVAGLGEVESSKWTRLIEQHEAELAAHTDLQHSSILLESYSGEDAAGGAATIDKGDAVLQQQVQQQRQNDSSDEGTRRLNTKLGMYALKGDWKSVDSILSIMRAEKRMPEVHALACLVRGSRTIARAEHYLNWIIASKIKPTKEMWAAILKTCNEKNDSKRAVSWLKRMGSILRRDGSGFIANSNSEILLSAITAFARLKNLKAIEQCIARLESITMSNLQAVHYQHIIVAYMEANALEQALGWHARMHEKGFRMDEDYSGVAGGGKGGGGGGGGGGASEAARGGRSGRRVGGSCSGYHQLIEMCILRNDHKGLKAWLSEMKTHWVSLASQELLALIADFYVSPSSSSSSPSSSSSSPSSSSSSSFPSPEMAARILSSPNIADLELRGMNETSKGRKMEYQAIEKVIQAFLNNGNVRKAEHWLHEMARRGLNADAKIYAMFLNGMFGGDIFGLDKALKASGECARSADWWVDRMRRDNVAFADVVSEMKKKRK